MKGCLAALALALLGCTGPGVHKVPRQTGLNTRADVVGSLQVTGVDVKSPVLFRLHLRLPSFADAQMTLREVRGFCQRVDLKEESPTVVYCIAQKTLVPDSDETESVLYLAKQAAIRNGGTFESWEIDFGR